MNKIPHYLNKYFETTSYILIYPMQAGVMDKNEMNLKNATFMEPIEMLDDIRKNIANIFKRK